MATDFLALIATLQARHPNGRTPTDPCAHCGQPFLRSDPCYPGKRIGHKEGNRRTYWDLHGACLDVLKGEQ